MRSAELKKRDDVMQMGDGNKNCPQHEYAQHAKRHRVRCGQLPCTVPESPDGDASAVQTIGPMLGVAGSMRVERDAEPKRDQAVEEPANRQKRHCARSRWVTVDREPPSSVIWRQQNHSLRERGLNARLWIKSSIDWELAQHGARSGTMPMTVRQVLTRPADSRAKKTCLTHPLIRPTSCEELVQERGPNDSEFKRLGASDGIGAGHEDSCERLSNPFRGVAAGKQSRKTRLVEDEPHAACSQNGDEVRG